jgi:centrosomal protein CEP104
MQNMNLGHSQSPEYEEEEPLDNQQQDEYGNR